MESKLISIIVPVYNTNIFLPKCINSILNQTYKNIELILVDDGSTDDSGDICEEYATKDSRVIVIHKKNEGQGVARNVALDIANGDYIGFVDSDDYILPNMFSKMVCFIERFEADIAVCGVINDHFLIKKECPKQSSFKLYNKEELFISFFREPYIRSILCNKLFKAELFADIRFSNIRAREDNDLIYKVFDKCVKAIYVPECLYVQHIRPGSTEQSDFSDEKLKSIYVVGNMTMYIKKHMPSIANYTELFRATAIKNAMREILLSKNFSDWRDKYFELFNELKNELDIHNCHDKVNDEKYMNLKKVEENQYTFVIRCRLNRLKLLIINFVKEMLIKTRSLV